MSITILLSRLLIAVLSVSCSAVSTPLLNEITTSATSVSSYTSKTAMVGSLESLSIGANSSKPTEFDASGDIVKVEVYTGDRQTLLATILDEDTLEPLNNEEIWSNSPENRIVWGKAAEALAAEVNGKEEYIFSLYRFTNAGPEWLCDITTHTGTYTARYLTSMGGIETYGLFDDPMESYQEASPSLLDYLRSIV